MIRQSTSTPSVLRTQLTEPSHKDSVSANNMHTSVVVPNKTAQYCDVTKSHQESETQSLSLLQMMTSLPVKVVVKLAGRCMFRTCHLL